MNNEYEDYVDSRTPHYRLKWYETLASHYIDKLIHLRDTEPEIRDLVNERLRELVKWTAPQIEEPKEKGE